MNKKISVLVVLMVGLSLAQAKLSAMEDDNNIFRFEGDGDQEEVNASQDEEYKKRLEDMEKMTFRKPLTPVVDDLNKPFIFDGIPRLVVQTDGAPATKVAEDSEKEVQSSDESDDDSSFCCSDSDYDSDDDDLIIVEYGSDEDVQRSYSPKEPELIDESHPLYSKAQKIWARGGGRKKSRLTPASPVSEDEYDSFEMNGGMDEDEAVEAAILASLGQKMPFPRVKQPDHYDGYYEDEYLEEMVPPSGVDTPMTPSYSDSDEEEMMREFHADAIERRMIEEAKRRSLVALNGGQEDLSDCDSVVGCHCGCGREEEMIRRAIELNLQENQEKNLEMEEDQGVKVVVADCGHDDCCGVCIEWEEEWVDEKEPGWQVLTILDAIIAEDDEGSRFFDEDWNLVSWLEEETEIVLALTLEDFCSLYKQNALVRDHFIKRFGVGCIEMAEEHLQKIRERISDDQICVSHELKAQAMLEAFLKQHGYVVSLRR